MNRDIVTTQLRTLLSDPSATIWSTALLDTHIDAALNFFSRQLPAEDYEDIATVDDSRDINIASLADLAKVYAVEWPIGRNPKEYQRFNVFADVLTMDSTALGDTTNARIYYGRYRKLYNQWKASTAYAVGDYVVPTTANGRCYRCKTAGTSGATQPTWGTTLEGDTSDGSVVWTCKEYFSISEANYPVLCLGASGYALEEYGRRILNSFNDGGPKVASDYMKRGSANLKQFQKEVRQLSANNRIRVRQLYSPRQIRPSRFTDPGP